MGRSCEVFFVIFIIYFGNVSLGSEDLIAITPVGDIQGTELEDINGQRYVAFRGIPYAKPPVGELRFAKPEPHPKFQETYDSTKEAKGCPQPEPFLFGREQGSEDCLTLNIFMRKFEPSTKEKKVMVFIHGGGFVAGSAMPYKAGMFVNNHDVIIVTINYRIGVLGFLSTADEASPGNYGLWDQALALKWVKDNVKAFGGDSDDVAISGESAGSASVSYLSISPVTKGLFTKGFLQSGTATSIFANSLSARHDALTLAKSVNCWDDESDASLDLSQSNLLIQCLRKVPESQFMKYTGFHLNAASFAPRVDGSFIPKTPLALLQDDSYLESVGFFEKSYLVGVDNSELAFMDKYFSGIEAMIFYNNETSQDDKTKAITSLSDAIVDFYTRSRLGVGRPAQAITNHVKQWYQRRTVRFVSELITDMAFMVPSYDFMNTAVRNKSTNVWLLYFNAFPAYMKGKYKGIPHSVDLLYWFDIAVQDWETLLQVGMEGHLDNEDLEMKKMFSWIIAEFTQKGDPSAAVKDKLPSGWPTYDLQGSHYLNFNLKPSVRRHLDRDKRDFWLQEFPALAARHRQHDEL